ncbi:MAG: SCP2 sterol-binding domain-containing protein [Actinomycetota bacterium]
MSDAFTPEWFDRIAPTLSSLPSAGAVDAVVQYVISSTPDGKVTFHAVIEQGVVIDVASGKASDPTAVISASYDAALDILEGRKSPDAGFMDASLKVEGDHKTWLLDLRDVRRAALTAIGAAG